MFFNELDIVESRLEYLYNKIDKFVIVEANITHSGKYKSYMFEENMSRYSKYMDKIVYHKAILDPSDYDFTRVVKKDDPTNPSWQVENAQRNHILNVLNQFSNDAFVMISDADEIPNKHIINNAIKNISFNQPAVAFAQDFFIYNLNQKLTDTWAGTVLTTCAFVKKQTPQWFRTNRNSFNQIKNGGWHISYVGSAETIQHKIESFAHQELNVDKFKDLNYIQERMNLGQDLYGRPYSVIQVNPNLFPKDFLKIFKKFLPNDKLIFVQIGAGAGDLDPRMGNRDGFTEYVKQLDKNSIGKIILVEPNPINIPKLKECWKNYPQAEIINVGICSGDADERSITFYYADKDAPHFQVFSMNSNHVTKHYPGEQLRSVVVNCITLQELIDQHIGKNKVDLLALDIEGIDSEIILNTDWNTLNCEFLSFEYIHLEDKERSVINLLQQSKYSFYGRGLDHNGYDWMFRKNI
jgi:FkbM family methyltransferase